MDAASRFQATARPALRETGQGSGWVIAVTDDRGAETDAMVVKQKDVDEAGGDQAAILAKLAERYDVERAAIQPETFVDLVEETGFRITGLDALRR